jgi:hypothetical protein
MSITKKPLENPTVIITEGGRSHGRTLKPVGNSKESSVSAQPPILQIFIDCCSDFN